MENAVIAATIDVPNDECSPNHAKAPPVRLRMLKLLAAALLSSWPSRLVVGIAFGKGGVPFRGTRIRTERRLSFAGPLLLAGKYERAEIDFVRKYLPQNIDVLELGASIGANSCQIAKHLDPGIRLTSVEANPALIEVLRANLARNAPERQVKLVHAVVGAEAGTAFFSPQQNSLVSLASDAKAGSVELRCETLASLVAKHCTGDFSLVSDVEGAEAAFLSDPDSLARCRFMIIEAHPAQHDGRTLSIEDVIALPLKGGRWRIKDRYGAVVAYERCSTDP
jgi:FkbM family methyltransferase